MLHFFNESISNFNAVAAQGQAAILKALSAEQYPDGGQVTAADTFLGNGPDGGPTRDANGLLAEATMVRWVGSTQPRALLPQTAICCLRDCLLFFPHSPFCLTIAE